MPLTWNKLYSETELYKTAVRLYTKPLFRWRKALLRSSDGRTLFDFARKGLRNLHGLHQTLRAGRFAFRPGVAVHTDFHGRERTLYVYPWEERLVDLLLYRTLNRALDDWFSTDSYAYRITGFGVDRCQRRIRGLLRRHGAPIWVVKRDISAFFASMDHEVLLAKLRAIVAPSDYLYRLLEQRVRFRFVSEETEIAAERGVPFGTAVACVLANIYLTDLDHEIGALPRVSLMRYADDYLILSPDRTAAERAVATFETGIARAGLRSKASHAQDLALGAGAAEGPFEPATRFRHLGLEFRADGSIGLSRDKARKIRNLFRYAFRRAARRLDKVRRPLDRARIAIAVACRTIGSGVRNVAIIDYYLRHVDDEKQLRLLDRWLAEEVLAIALRRGHKKGNFRSLPFARLRELGLPSLVHRRRLILRGDIESPFFVWQNDRTGRRRGTAVRTRAGTPEVASFSRSPEAAADRASSESPS